MNLSVQDLLCQDARIQDLYFNISEMKLSITSLYIIYDAPKYETIWTENSNEIYSFFSEILKYESSVIVCSTEKFWAILFTPILIISRLLQSRALSNCSYGNPLITQKPRSEKDFSQPKCLSLCLKTVTELKLNLVLPLTLKTH